MACEPNTLANDAACMCLSIEQHMQVQTLLFATLAGGSLDPNVLAAQAAPLQGVPTNVLMAMKTALFCQFLNG